jgi:hypothetical protein
VQNSLLSRTVRCSGPVDAATHALLFWDLNCSSVLCTPPTRPVTRDSVAAKAQEATMKYVHSPGLWALACAEPSFSGAFGGLLMLEEAIFALISGYHL